MAKIIKMPVLGIAIANISINEWFIEVGDKVSQGQPLLEVQTDKITMEVPSEESGSLLKIFFDKDSQLTDGVPIAIIGEPGENIDSLVAQVHNQLRGLDLPQPELESPEPSQTDVLPGSEPEPVKPTGEVLATPLVRRIARERGVDLSKVTPTGPGGRISKKDVLAHLETAQPIQPGSIKEDPVSEDEILEIIPLSGTRKVIADNMVRSVQTTPHYTIDAEVDCTQLVILRDKLKNDFKNIHGVDLTYVPFVVKAMAMAVHDVPLVNATIREDKILVQKVAHVGVAVAKGDLLYVPVIRQPINKTLLQIARETMELATLVREDQLTLDHLLGSTITLTNMGIVDLGSDGGTSVINPPEVAVICMGRVRDRVVPVDGEIVIQPSMRLLFTYDHRVVMGIPGAKFAEKMKAYLEHPELLIAS